MLLSRLSAFEGQTASWPHGRVCRGLDTIITSPTGGTPSPSSVRPVPPQTPAVLSLPQPRLHCLQSDTATRQWLKLLVPRHMDPQGSGRCRILGKLSPPTRPCLAITTPSPLPSACSAIARRPPSYHGTLFVDAHTVIFANASPFPSL